MKPMEIPFTGSILLSQPSLNDRFFSRSVVMLAEHGEDGTFGFIVNKPTKIKLSEVTKAFLPFESEIYLGGPVNIDNLFFVHTKGDVVRDSLKIIDGVYWGGDMEQIRELLLNGGMTLDEIRFYVGYSGWEPKQLDREMKENSWLVCPASRQFVFGKRQQILWKKIVLSLGNDYAQWVNYPADPTMN